MKEELILYKTAKLAKEKGFDELCDYSYEGSILSKTYNSWRNSEDPTEIAAPTQSLLQKWLREKHKIHIKIDDFIDDKSDIEWDYEVVIIGTELDKRGNYVPLIPYDSSNSEERKFNSYEEALESALYESLKLIKNENN